MLALVNNFLFLRNNCDYILGCMDKIHDIDRIVNDRNNQEIEKAVAAYLIENKRTLTCAESCTGGYLSHLLTALAGSSAYFMGSIVAYSDEIKKNILCVPNEILLQDGAVSEACVVEMTQNARKLFQTDYAIAVSGIAGPGGATLEKPIGTVWVAIALQNRCITHLFRFGNDNRTVIIRKTAMYALHLLLTALINTKH